MKNKLLLFGILSTMIFACRITGMNEREQPVNTEFQSVCDEALFGAGEEGLDEQQIVIRDAETITALIDQMGTVNKLSCEDDLRNIDLNELDVICIFDRVRGTAGYVVKINTVTETNERIIINYSIQKPEGPAAEVMTQPFLIATMSKSLKNVQFKLSE